MIYICCALTLLLGCSPFLRGNFVRLFRNFFSTHDSDPMGVRGVTNRAYMKGI